LDAATGLGTQRENVIAWLRSIGAQPKRRSKHRRYEGAAKGPAEKLALKCPRRPGLYEQAEIHGDDQLYLHVLSQAISGKTVKNELMPYSEPTTIRGAVVEQSGRSPAKPSANA
jgi:hypothetical protein